MAPESMTAFVRISGVFLIVIGSRKCDEGEETVVMTLSPGCTGGPSLVTQIKSLGAPR